ncbi:MAG: tetratricopeptide repeat protein, partial [Thermodesulfobacteriota bacterium]
MKIQKTNFLLKPVSLALLAVLFILIFLSAYQMQRWDTDIFWALKSGERIVQNFEVPKTDPFSYTFTGKKWIDFTWGFQVFAHIFYTYLGGWFGLFLLQSTLVSLTFIFLYRNLKLLSPTRAWLVFSPLFLVFAGSHLRFIIRPHLFVYFFISLYLYLLNLSEVKGDRRYLYLLIPLQVLWTNVHSSFVLGLFIVGSWALGSFIDKIRADGRGAATGALIGKLILIPLALLIVSHINPYGYELVFFPFIHMGGENAEALKHIAEWTKLPRSLLILRFYPFPIHYFAFNILAIGTALSFALNYRAVKAREVIMTLLIFYMAFQHVRWMMLFIFFSAPVLVYNTATWLDAGEGEKERIQKWVAGAATLITLFLVVALIYEFAITKDKSEYGLGLKSGIYPEGTVKFIKENNIRGNFYNEYVYGGYLIYNNPENKVFIDGRTPTVYSPYFFWTSRLINDEKRWSKLASEHSLDMALIKHNTPYCDKFQANKEWIAVNFDDVSVLYLKDGAKHRSVIDKYAYRHVSPCSSSNQYTLSRDSEELLLMKEELKSAVARGDGEIARPLRLLGLIDTDLGGEHLEEGARVFARSLELTDSPYTRYDLGLILLKLKRYGEALREFKMAVANGKNFKEGHYGMGLAYYHLPEYGNAITQFEKYIDLAGDGSKFLAYKFLGLAYFKVSEYERALRNLKRAAFITESTEELAEIN